jgi:putative polyhydroxyalkanoate system protein
VATIRLHKATTMPRRELRATAAELAAELEAAHGVRAHWESDDEISIRGAGFEGRLLLAADAVEVTVRLGLLASAFREPVRAEIQRYLDEHVS